MEYLGVAVIIIVLLLLPIGILIVTNVNAVKQQLAVLWFSSKHSTSPRYTVTSTVPDYTATVVNTNFLEYEFAKFKL